MVLDYIRCEHFIENNYVLIQMILSETSFFQQETIREKENTRGKVNILNGVFTFCFWHLQVFGLMTKPLIRLLLPSPKHLSRMISSEPTTPKSFIVPLLESAQDSEADLGQNVPRPHSLRMLLSTPSHTVHRYWRKFDNAFMRPVFGGRGFVPFVPGSPTEPSDH